MSAEPQPDSHRYTHVGHGRWVCETCRVFIVNADCRFNREQATA